MRYFLMINIENQIVDTSTYREATRQYSYGDRGEKSSRENGWFQLSYYDIIILRKKCVFYTG